MKMDEDFTLAHPPDPPQKEGSFLPCLKDRGILSRLGEQVPLHWQSEYGEWWLVPRHDLNMIASFKDINGCYRWLQEQRIDVFHGWYPTRNERGWEEMGSRQ